MAFSNYAENLVLQFFLGTNAPTRPANLYIALCTVAVTDSDSGSTLTEPSSANGYARYQSDPGDTRWLRPGDGTASNSVQIGTFGPATASWGTISHFAICTAATGGQVIWHGAFSTAKAVGTGDRPTISVSELDIVLN